MSRRVLRFILVMLGASFALTSCKEEGTGPATSVVVVLTNHSIGPITILAEGESLSSCTNCQLTAGGGYRNVQIQMSNGETFEFQAYFGGAFYAEVTCKWTGETAISVDWDGLDLKCIVWSEA